MPDGPFLDETERRLRFDHGNFYGQKGMERYVPAATASGCGGCVFTVVVLALIAFVVVGLLTGTLEGDDGEDALDLSGDQEWVGSLDCTDGPMGLAITMRQSGTQDESTTGIDLDLDLRYYPEPLGTGSDLDEGSVGRRSARGILDGSSLAFEVDEPGDQPFSATSGLGTIEESDGSSDYAGGVAAPACTTFDLRKQTT